MIENIHSPYIVDATSDNFKSLVLDNSHSGPVLANFWSRKAGPCLRQYPILDQLVHQYEGRLLLVNIDTEKERVFTKEYGIASVPTLKLFRYGEVVETWHGYQSAEGLTKVLDLYVARDSDQALAQAIQLYAEGQREGAYELVANAIIEDPINPRLPLTMCKLLTHEERYDEALKLIDALPEDIRKNTDIVQLHALLSFFIDIDTTQDMNALVARIKSSPNDLDAKQQLVAHYVIQQQYEQALQELVSIMERDPSYKENYAQKAMLKVFDIVGRDHELVSRYRSNLMRYSH
jgi:putative thioredoxin